MKLRRNAPRTITIGRKLFLSFSASAAITLLIAVVGFFNNAILSSTVARVVESTSVRQTLAGAVGLDFSELLSIERSMNLRLTMKDGETAGADNREFLNDSTHLSALLDRLAPLLVSESDRHLCAQLIALNLQLRHVHDLTYMQSSAGTNRSPAPGASDLQYKTYKDQFLPQATLASTVAAQLRQNQAALIQQDSQGAAQTEVRSRYLTSFMLVLFFIVGSVLTRIVITSTRSLREITANLGRGATQIAGAALQVSCSSQSLARGASEQAAFIEQTSASAEAIAVMARRNTGNAQTTAGMVAESQRYIVDGNHALDQMIAAMDGIALSSRKISTIVKRIDQIAFQTNILALNAAVEAARAGEAGLSFAVVAEEVRNLAQRSAQAAKDTAELIEDCIAKSNTGKLKVDEVGAAIRSITAESAKVKLLVDEICEGSREQSRGIDQVSNAVLKMERVTHGTAAGAEQSASAAEQLNIQFQTLKDIAHDLATMLGSNIPGRSPGAVSSDSPRSRSVEANSAIAVPETQPELQPL